MLMGLYLFHQTTNREYNNGHASHGWVSQRFLFQQQNNKDTEPKKRRPHPFELRLISHPGTVFRRKNYILVIRKSEIINFVDFYQ